jgi:hypothetical protein
VPINDHTGAISDARLFRARSCGLQASHWLSWCSGHRGAVVQRTVLVEAGSDSSAQERQPRCTCMWREAGWDDVRTVALASDMARQRAAGSAIVVGGSRPQKRVGRRNEELAFSHASTLVSACRTRRGALTSRQPCSNQQWSAPCQQALEIHAQHQASNHVAQNALQWWPRCMVVRRGDRGPARRAHQHPLKSKAVPSRTHMPEVPHDIYICTAMKVT